MKERKKIIGIVGSRKCNSDIDYARVKAAFFTLYEQGDWICSGACPRGADAFAERIAKENGIPILLFPAGTLEAGTDKFFRRNDLIAKTSDILIACLYKNQCTGGTGYTVDKFTQSHGNTVNRLFLI